MSRRNQHNSEEDLWIAVDNIVYHILPSVLKNHGQSKQFIIDLAGKDLSDSFETIHPKSILKQLPIVANLK